MRMLSKDAYLRGSTLKCPKCGSRAVVNDPNLKIDGHGPGIAACGNCKIAWESFGPAEIWDRSDAFCSFREPCNNCAFRPGSPEQQDTEQWRQLIASLRGGGQFYCHKGVPIDPEAEHGFAYPHKRVVTIVDGREIVTEVPNRDRLRLCRGYLTMLPSLARIWDREAAE